jgi:hypothetical protein
LPREEELAALLTQPELARRESLVDRLISSDEFIEFWTYRLSQLLRVAPPGGDTQAMITFDDWLRRQVADDAPWSETVRGMLTASGDTHTHGAALVHRLVNDGRQQAEYFSEVFCGITLRCANCHNHPLDRWTQDDYHGLAQIFAATERGRVVSFGSTGQLIHPRTGQFAVPRIPGVRFVAQNNIRDAAPDVLASVHAERDPRTLLLDWLLADDNPYFARAMVNRVWSWLMGRGLVEPVDDLRATNPATHPELLDQLAQQFRQDNYRLRPLVRTICLSAAYQRAPAAQLHDPQQRYYTRAVPKRLAPAVLAGAVDDMTRPKGAGTGIPAGSRFAALRQTADRATLGAFSDCPTDRICPVNMAPQPLSVANRLRLLNGPELNERLAGSNSIVDHILSTQLSTRASMAMLFRQTLAVEPTPAELNYWQDELDNARDQQDRRERLEDLVWSLLSSDRFAVNW